MVLAFILLQSQNMNQVCKGAISIIPQYRINLALTIMANSYGPCDNFMSFGSSAVWDKNGVCIAKLGESENGLVGVDTLNGETFIMK